MEDASESSFSVDATKLTQLEYNLLDVNADGTVTLSDAKNLLCAYCNVMVKGVDALYFSEERYDLYDGAYYCKNGLDIK